MDTLFATIKFKYIQVNHNNSLNDLECHYMFFLITLSTDDNMDVVVLFLVVMMLYNTFLYNFSSYLQASINLTFIIE